MLPRIPGLPFPPTYGILAALGFVAALLLAGRLAPRRGLEPKRVQDVIVWAAVWGLLGAKALLVLLEPRSFLESPLSLISQGGVFYGGLVAAIASVLFQSWREGIDPHAYGDVAAPALALGHAFGRVGCFLAGCCWGTACDLPWAVHYTDPRSVANAHGVPDWLGVHPVQLYEAAANLALCGLTLSLLLRGARTGRVWWSYVVAYGAARFVLEMFRGDERGSVLGGLLSTSQLVGVLAVVVGVAALVVLQVRSRRSEAGGGRDAAGAADASP